jgi:hypothetical protein
MFRRDGVTTPTNAANKPRKRPMPYSMSQASLPVFEIGLTALSNVLDKAASFASAKKIEPTVLLQSRLSPDMFAFTRQVQIACDQAKNGTARLAGVEPPRFEDNEATIDELNAHRQDARLHQDARHQGDRQWNRPRNHFPAGPGQQGAHEGR